MMLIETNRGIIAMADVIDYGMWKFDKAWELAMRVIPPRFEDTGRWTEKDYLVNVQKELTRAYEIVNTVFVLDKLNQ